MKFLFAVCILLIAILSQLRIPKFGNLTDKEVVVASSPERCYIEIIDPLAYPKVFNFI